MKTKIADGNSKLGAIPNVSTVPGKDCGNSDKCVKDCYAVKFYRMYPSVKNAWGNNSEIVHTNRDQFFSDIAEYLTKKTPEWFRWHVSGDILDQDYLERMKQTAREFPNVHFLAFTKMHMLNYKQLPSNLVIVASMWPGLKIPTNVENMPKAWMDNGTETRIPDGSIPCPGRCDQCMMCWHLPSLKRDVVFHKH